MILLIAAAVATAAPAPAHECPNLITAEALICRAIQAQANGDIPRGMREGGAVGIHGTDLPILNVGNVDWTTGCISIDNDAISELARLLPIRTLVVIKP